MRWNGAAVGPLGELNGERRASTNSTWVQVAPAELIGLLGVASFGHKTVIRTGLAALMRDARASNTLVAEIEDSDSEDENGMIKEYSPHAELTRERSNQQLKAIAMAEQLAEGERLNKLVAKEKRESRASMSMQGQGRPTSPMLGEGPKPASGAWRGAVKVQSSVGGLSWSWSRWVHHTHDAPPWGVLVCADRVNEPEWAATHG